MATSKAINCLSTAELSVLLSVFHLDVPGRLTAQEKLGILKNHSGYTAPFGKYSFDQVHATFSSENNGKAQLKFVSFYSASVTDPECDSPCNVCKKDVLNGIGPRGDGIVLQIALNIFIMLVLPHHWPERHLMLSIIHLGICSWFVFYVCPNLGQSLWAKVTSLICLNFCLKLK